jgi:DNA-binding LytR/AlgR family response regulator
LLLDDELPGLSYLKLLCEQIPEVEVVRVFNDPEVFLKEFPELEFDLCILDIEMPGTNGIQLAEMLKGKSVIFTTAYKEYAAHAFELDAVDYVVKPVRIERLRQAVTKAIQRKATDQPVRKYTRINTDKGNVQLFFDQVIYIRTSEIDSRDKTAFLENGVSLQLKNISFAKLQLILPSEFFCQINKRELIALNRVIYFSNDQITTNIILQSEKPLILTLGEPYRKEFISKINLNI